MMIITDGSLGILRFHFYSKGVLCVLPLIMVAAYLSLFACLVQGSYKTSESWKIEFPEYSEKIAESQRFRVSLNTDSNKYEVDLSTALHPIVLRYLSIINFALLNFTPSKPELFAEFPIAVITARESITEPKVAQAGRDNLHMDESIRGFTTIFC
jgi:hypothetical protein